MKKEEKTKEKKDEKKEEKKEKKIEEKAEEMQEQDGRETETPEDIREYMEEDYQESGYKEHGFSLLDNPLEIFTVLFMVVYLVYVIWQFTNLLGTGMTVSGGFEYWLDAIVRLIPAIVLLVACEIYEKMQMLEYNIKLNSYYMAQYQMNLVSRLENKDQKDKS